MAKTRIAVKFCGGCNPGYDRRAAYETIRGDVAARVADSGNGDEVDFVQAEEGVLYDALLVINGCSNRCAAVSELRSKTTPIYVWKESDVADATSTLTERIQSNASGALTR
ncbi:MAG: hypothetical protein LBL54_05155 [Clostridiales Family XIII bacterium]|jgi:3-hydroxyacyl-[acyl-carrier-protein] dehydratase|nr:hypothetical protein [Clostridiales Family XIII bacterium]